MATFDASGIRPGEGDVFPGDEHGIAVFRRKDGTMKVFSAECPHAHCDVMWNSTAKEWDCPCHGSRFDAEGNVIGGPASTNLTTLEEKQEGDTVEIKE